MTNGVTEENEHVFAKKSGIHNTGVFAKKFIPKGTKVIEYVGELISKKESEKRADAILEESKVHKEKGAVYIFEINKKYDLDGNVPYNTARFINHSCNPNCESENINDKIWITAIKDIKKGEEILYNYGYDIDNFDEHPCFCGAENCRGFIASDDKWEKLKKVLQKNYENKKVLVVYYSRTGNTKRVAEYLAKEMNFELDEIKTNNRKGIVGYVKSGYESASNKKPKITFQKNPKDYDLIIIGTPTWANTISSPVNTYLDNCKNLNLAAFCTMGGKNQGKIFSMISSKTISFKGLIAINSKKIKQNKYQHALIEFFRKIQL